uniref:Domain of unknown function with conserved HDNR motif domain-containing protein n=1 Tax=Spermophilus dauricus TaxID=99837 RepID=A0A8C9PMQ6_SPEDA
MPKGRRFNPPPDKDGRWFPHIGLTQMTPGSLTSATLKEPHYPHSSGRVEGKLPPIYKVREKQAEKENFPFSVHDNRHSLENSGYYFDSLRALDFQRPAGDRGLISETKQVCILHTPILRTHIPSAQ